MPSFVKSWRCSSFETGDTHEKHERHFRFQAGKSRKAHGARSCSSVSQLGNRPSLGLTTRAGFLFAFSDSRQTRAALNTLFFGNSGETHCDAGEFPEMHQARQKRTFKGRNAELLRERKTLRTWKKLDTDTLTYPTAKTTPLKTRDQLYQRDSMSLPEPKKLLATSGKSVLRLCCKSLTIVEARCGLVSVSFPSDSMEKRL